MISPPQINLQISAEGGVSLPVAVSPSRFAVRVEIDVSTKLRESPLPKDRVEGALAELWEFADEIAEKGDIP